MLKLNVPNMTCSHCAGNVEKTVKSVDPEAQVRVDLNTGLLTIVSDKQSDRFSEALVAAGYPNSVA